MVVTKAGRALRAALSASNPKRKMTQAELARRLGISQPSVSEWTRFQSRPESHFRKAIQGALGIPENDWMTAAELRIATGNDAA
jgi:transcriptional regulator with XRE-family HTH domain